MVWQPVALLYPDAELLVTTALRPLITAAGQAGVHVGRSIPNQRPQRMVIVNRDGGGSDGVTDQARLRVRVWDTTAQGANDLARLVLALMPQLVGVTPITRFQHVSGPFEVPDPASAMDANQRYLLIQIAMEGTPL